VKFCGDENKNESTTAIAAAAAIAAANDTTATAKGDQDRTACHPPSYRAHDRSVIFPLICSLRIA